MSKKVAVIVGSLRKGSYALKIAKNTLDMFSDEFEPEIVEIRDLPLYDADYDDAAMTDKPLPEGYSSNKNLRLALSYFVMPTVQQPEVFLGHSPELLDEEGHFNNEGTQAFVQSYIDQFEEVMKKHPKA